MIVHYPTINKSCFGFDLDLHCDVIGAHGVVNCWRHVPKCYAAPYLVILLFHMLYCNLC